MEDYNETTSVQAFDLSLYNFYIPLLGVFVIFLNLLVVVSSGLLIEIRKLKIDIF